MKNLAAIADSHKMDDGSRVTPANTTTRSSVPPFPDSHVTNCDPAFLATLPKDLKFDDQHLLTIIIYSVLIFISLVGNVSVLIVMCRRRQKSRARINTTLMHLAIADLLVSTYV